MLETKTYFTKMSTFRNPCLSSKRLPMVNLSFQGFVIIQAPMVYLTFQGFVIIQAFSEFCIPYLPRICNHPIFFMTCAHLLFIKSETSQSSCKDQIDPPTHLVRVVLGTLVSHMCSKILKWRHHSWAIAQHGKKNKKQKQMNSPFHTLGLSCSWMQHLQLVCWKLSGTLLDIVGLLKLSSTKRHKNLVIRGKKVMYTVSIWSKQWLNQRISLGGHYAGKKIQGRETGNIYKRRINFLNYKGVLLTMLEIRSKAMIQIPCFHICCPLIFPSFIRPT